MLFSDCVHSHVHIDNNKRQSSDIIFFFRTAEKLTGTGKKLAVYTQWKFFKSYFVCSTVWNILFNISVHNKMKSLPGGRERVNLKHNKTSNLTCFCIVLHTDLVILVLNIKVIYKYLGLYYIEN